MPGSSFAGAPRGTEQKAMHAEVHEDVSLSYGILKCLDPEVRWCGDIGAVTDSELGETPLGTATLWDFATRSAAAIIASRTVLMGSSADITETIPASQAWAIISWVSLRGTGTPRSGLVRGRDSRSKARSSSTKTQFRDGSGLSRNCVLVLD